MTLLMVQAWLINAKNVALHRSLDRFGIALGTGVLFTGMRIAGLGMSSGTPTAPFYYDLFYLSLAALGAVLTAWFVWLVVPTSMVRLGRTATHQRLGVMGAVLGAAAVVLG
jgi:hypothetical protein